MLTEIHSDLCCVYASNHFGPVCNSINVTEIGQEATVKSVTIVSDSQLFQIKNSFLKAGSSRYDNGGASSSADLGHDCDGAFLVEKAGQTFLVLLELKSSYSKSSLEKAKKQFLSSYHNLISEFLGLSSFDPSRLKVCCMLASHPLSDENKTKYLKWKQIGNGLDGFCKRALHYALHPDTHTLFQKSEDPTINEAPIKVTHLFNEAPLFHLAVPEGSDSETFNVDSLLSKILP